MSEHDHELVARIFDQIATNLTMLVDRELDVSEVNVSREHERPAGADVIHISFRLRFETEEAPAGFGSLLVPLPDARSLAAYLMMAPDEEVEEHRDDQDLDQGAKDAMVELGNFVGAAVQEACRESRPGLTVQFAGCQGVRADVRPAFEYREGDELLVARATTRLHTFPAFEAILMMPAAAFDAVAA